MDLYPYSVTTLKEMFNLRKGDIEDLIVSEGVPLYSALREEYIGYLPSISSAFPLGFAEAEKVSKNVIDDNYIITKEGSLLVLKSTKTGVPASSMLYRGKWLDKLSKALKSENKDLGDCLVLIPSKVSLPVFIGEANLIERLSLGFADDIKVFKLVQLIRGYNV